MIDGAQVWVVTYNTAATGVKLSGRVFIARPGDVITVNVTNNDNKAHNWAIKDLNVRTAVINPGATQSTVFTVPAGTEGTFIYEDEQFSGVYRPLGLHGAFIVLPTGASDQNGPAYTGEPTYDDHIVWYLNALDPAWGLKAKNAQTIDPATYAPRYFTINGLSGIDSDHKATGALGELVRPVGPLNHKTLIRMMNVGLVTHSPHFHGNHVVLEGTNAKRTSGIVTKQSPDDLHVERDIVRMPPSMRKDVRLRFLQPTDAYPAIFTFPRDQKGKTIDERLSQNCTPGSTGYQLDYPMHCHAELSQTADGGLYPNGMLTGWSLIDTTFTPDSASALDLSCNVTKLGSPATPCAATPFQTFTRKVFTSGQINMPDGFQLKHWGFEDEQGNKTLPSTPIVAKEGNIYRTRVEAATKVHTIHQHGIEPDPLADGVGHTSFEISGAYEYQWRPMNPGTYIYHCHVNTTLHFKMGLWGALIVQPASDPGNGRKWLYVGGPQYDKEYTWPVFSADPRYQDINHAAGLCDPNEDPGLNRYDPKYFFINGVFGNISGQQPVTITDPKVAMTQQLGQQVLLRYIEADYFPQQIIFEDGLQAQIMRVDGYGIPDSQPTLTSFFTSSAERYDLFLKPPSTGVFGITVKTFHWATGALVGQVHSTLTVT
jgi:FtsP/CotA-like multicopper oxidase with cupredoxin domain